MPPPRNRSRSAPGPQLLCRGRVPFPAGGDPRCVFLRMRTRKRTHTHAGGSHLLADMWGPNPFRGFELARLQSLTHCWCPGRTGVALASFFQAHSSRHPGPFQISFRTPAQGRRERTGLALSRFCPRPTAAAYYGLLTSICCWRLHRAVRCAQRGHTSATWLM